MIYSTAKSAIRRGFTLIEMMVAVSILVVIILSIGVVFKGASNSVGISQSSLAMLSNVRAIQQQISTDVGAMNKDAFLVIRCGFFTDTQGVLRRCDQVCFISRGSFPHRTGTTSGTGSFTDSTVAPSAFIWWGQLAMERNAPGGPNVVGPSESATLGLDQIPTPAKALQLSPTRSASTVEEINYVLGRSAMLLIPQNAAVTAGGGANMSPSGPSIGTFCSSTIAPTLPGTNGNWPTNAIDYYYPSPAASPNHHQWINGAETADITQSRLDTAATSADGIMSSIRAIFAYPITRDPTNASGYYQVSGGILSAFNRFEADHFCYRRGALGSPYDGTLYGSISGMANGYFRMHPMALQGVSSFAVDWTDGGTYTDTNADMAGGTYAAHASATVDLVTGKLVGRPAGAPPGTPLSGEPMLGSTRWFGLCDRSKQPGLNDIVGYARGRTGPGGGTPLIIAHQYTTAGSLGTDKLPSDPDFSLVTGAANSVNSDPYVDNGPLGGTVAVAANLTTAAPSGHVNTATVVPGATYTGPNYASGDLYTAIFSYDTPRTNWPVALRFRYHVADPTGRLPNGRDFVQIVRLPTE